MPRGLQILFVCAFFVLGACASQTAPASAPTAVTGKFDVTKFVGTYNGTWTNSKTGANGTVTIGIQADPAAHNATITLDFGGNFMGLGDPPPASVTATYDDKMAYVKGNNPFLGDMDITIDADGNINGLVKNLGGGAIPSVTYTGKIGNGRMDADYHITFPNSATADARLRTQK